VGSQRILQSLEKIQAGDGRMDDIDKLYSLCAGIAGHTFCPFGDALVAPMLSSLDHFREEYETYIKKGQPLVAA
jgi:NADH-quinone oxidoreductase subunit F